MTQVDFYIIGEQSARTLDIMVCKLCNKALDRGFSVYINARNETQAYQLEEHLWTFKADSFLPHQNLLTDSSLINNVFIPIIINVGEQIPDGYDQLMINLDKDIPHFFSRFQRVAELVDSHENEKLMGRSRYRYYSDRGYLLKKHDL